MGETRPELYVETLRELLLDNRSLANLLGVGLRTVERHGHNLLIMPQYAHRFVRVVHARNPDLARRLAGAAGTSLVALGLEPGTPEQRAAARNGAVPSPDDALDVIRAASSATGLGLEEARAGVGAAVAMAVDKGLTLEALDLILNPKKPSRR